MCNNPGDDWNPEWGGRSKSYIAGGISPCSKIAKTNKGTLQLQLFPGKYTGVGGNNAVAGHKQKSDCIDCISHDHKMSQRVLSICDTPKKSWKELDQIGNNVFKFKGATT